MNLGLAKLPRTVCEVGAGDLFTCKSAPFWARPETRVVLFEPNPLLYASLLPKVLAYPNVHLYNVAIYSEAGLGYLVSAGVLSYLPEVESPINTIFRGKLTPMMEPVKVTVPRMTFDTFDNGDIDILYLGMEGAEYTVFPRLHSRPHVIVLNNHFANDYGYAFPRFDVIQAWCQTNGYQICPGIPDITLVSTAALAAGHLVQS